MTNAAEASAHMPSHVPSAQTPDGSPDRKKLPLALKIYGILLIVGALISLPVFALVIAGMVLGMQELTAQLDVNTYVIFGIYLVANAISAVTELVFGINLLRNKRRFARQV